MKLIKILAFAVSLTLILSLVGCDFSTLLGGDDTELNDDSFGKHYGDSSGTDDENDGNNDDGNNDDGNNDVGNNDDGEEDDGNVNENPDHVCDYKLFSKKEATCLAEGEEIYKCSCGKEQKKTLDVLSHTEVIDPAQEPSGSKPGKTEGKHCSVCGTVIVEQKYIFVDDYAVPEKYDGDYAYNSLLKLPNGEKLTKLYNEIDKVADNFHNGDADLTVRTR